MVQGLGFRGFRVEGRCTVSLLSGIPNRMPEPAAAYSCGRHALCKQRVGQFSETLNSSCCPRKKKAALLDAAAQGFRLFVRETGYCLCMSVSRVFLPLVRSSAPRFSVRPPARPSFGPTACLLVRCLSV